jgi:hypothetical protein
MFALPSPFLFFVAILLFPFVLAGSIALDAVEAEVEEKQ